MATLFKQLFLSFFIIKLLFKLALNYLNFQTLKRNAGSVPDILKDVVSAEKLRIADSYNAQVMLYQTTGFLFDSLVLILFLFTPLFGIYTRWINSLSSFYIFQTALFFLMVSLATWILDLPFGFYFHFVIEKRFGFNKYTIGKWFLDELKNLLVESIVLLVSLLVVLIIWGRSLEFSLTRVFLGWLVSLALSLILMYLVPVLLLPFFYKLKPVENLELKQAIAKLTEKSGYKVKKIMIADESNKSTHANAMFSGFGKSKTIIIFDTLINNYTTEEITAILAHEIGHGKRKHMLKTMTLTNLELFVFLLTASWLLSTDFLFRAFHVSNQIFSGIFIIYILFFDVVLYFVQPLFSGLSRKFEYEADAFSSKMLGSGKPLQSAFKKFVVNELDNINPHWLYEAFYYSHPKLLRRIEALDKS